MAGLFAWLHGKLIATVQRLSAYGSCSSSSSSSVSSNEVEEALEQLKRRFLRIQAVLHDAEEREVSDESVKLWLREITAIAYDADDVLDEYEYERLRSEIEGRAATAAICHKRKRVEEDDDDAAQVSELISALTKLSIPDGMVFRIQEIMKRFDEIADDRDALCLRDEDGERRRDCLMNSPPSSSLVNESDVYGRNDDKEKVIELLLSEHGFDRHGISVIPIVGMGGVGKTTLAKIVYNDPRVCDYFSRRVWVCASEDFDVVRLTKAIMKSLTACFCLDSELDQIQSSLKEELKGRRVLLVLDDVWNDRRSLWESLRTPLVCAGMIKIIVTTRNETVAKIMQTMPSYHLGCLPNDESWLLFQEYAFVDCDPNEQLHLVQIGRQILEKCGGLPLAIKALGSLLQHETDEERWIDILQSDLWELDQTKTEILPALRLSYQRMPAHLKPCFLYSSLFLKDQEFVKDELIRLWMAQGYIQPRGIKRVEDIGGEYFDELHRRSFFQSRVSSIYEEEVFEMHDLIHDLAVSISGKEFHAVVIEDDNSAHGISREVRHLNVISRLDDEPLTGLLPFGETNALRTLLYDGFDDSLLGNQLQITSFKCLRALELTCNGIEVLPDSIGNLKHLRYLRLESQRIEALPESVCRLYNLQTLDLTKCFSLKEIHSGIGNHINLHYLSLQWTRIGELPNGIGDVINLVHLHLRNSHIRRLPESVCYLYNLRTLDLVDCPRLKELPNEIGNLINLRYLGISSYEIKRLPESVCRLCNLETLDLKSCDNLEELPRGIGNLVNLHHLEVYDGEFGSEVVCMPLGIGKLTNLQTLSAFRVARPNQHCGGLGELKDLVNIRGKLSIRGLKNSVGVEDAKRANLKNKSQLQQLRLQWSGGGVCKHGDFEFGDERDEENFVHGVFVDEEIEEAVLDSLQPHANLTELIIDGYGGSRFPSWVSSPSFTKLIAVSLKQCGSMCKVLPPLGQLPSLKSLTLYKMDGIQCIGRDFCTASITKDVSFPFLEMLEFEDMPWWEEWCGVLDGDFPRLQCLTIWRCPMLHRLPTLKSLQSLFIRGCENLKSLALHQSPYFPSMLQVVHIGDCLQLTSLVGLCHLNSLTELEISMCPQLQLSLDEQRLPSMLQDVCISDCWSLTSVAGLRDLTSLQRLEMSRCPCLYLSEDEVLASRPKLVEITGCPLLKEWCRWHGIPYLQWVDYSTNKMESKVLIGEDQGIEKMDCDQG